MARKNIQEVFPLVSDSVPHFTAMDAAIRDRLAQAVATDLIALSSTGNLPFLTIEDWWDTGRIGEDADDPRRLSQAFGRRVRDRKPVHSISLIHLMPVIFDSSPHWSKPVVVHTLELGLRPFGIDDIYPWEPDTKGVKSDECPTIDTVDDPNEHQIQDMVNMLFNLYKSDRDAIAFMCLDDMPNMIKDPSDWLSPKIFASGYGSVVLDRAYSCTY